MFAKSEQFYLGIRVSPVGEDSQDCFKHIIILVSIIQNNEKIVKVHNTVVVQILPDCVEIPVTDISATVKVSPVWETIVQIEVHSTPEHHVTLCRDLQEWVDTDGGIFRI